MLTEVNCKVFVNAETGRIYLVFRDEDDAVNHEHLFENRFFDTAYACCDGFMNALEIL